jgi:hypothetical protein
VFRQSFALKSRLLYQQLIFPGSIDEITSLLRVLGGSIMKGGCVVAGA